MNDPNATVNHAGMMAEHALVMLPGLDGDGFSFRKLLEQLPATLQPMVIRYPRDRVLGYDELLAFVEPQLPASPFVLLGDSFSSPLAIRLASCRPVGLQGLILTSGFARNPLWSSPTWLAPLARPVVSALYKPYIHAKVWWRGGGPAGEERLAGLEGLRPAVMGHRAAAVLRVNVLDDLAICPVPALYVRGRRDRLVPGRNLSEMRRRLPSMQVAEFDSGHCVLRSNAARAAAAISAFVVQCDVRPLAAVV